MLKHLRRLSTELLFKNPWWEYHHDRYLRPDDSEGDFYYLHTPGSVAVIPRFDDGRLVLLRQFRYLNQRESLEFPGGGLKPGHTPEESAREELLEEAGLVCNHLRLLGSFNPMNGATDEICHVFLAEGLERHESKPEASEEFVYGEYSPKQLDELVRSGELWDGMTLSALALLDRVGT